TLQIFLDEIEISLRDAAFGESRQMQTGVLSQLFAPRRIVDQLRESIGQGTRVVVRKSDAARSDRFGKPALIRTDYDATASNRFQSNDPKRLGPARRSHEDAMPV